MKKGVMETGFSPLDSNIYWNRPKTWVWIPGTHWQACIYPTFIDFVCFQTGLKRRFSWHMGAIEKFEGYIDLKRGQVRLILHSLDQYLQIALWADTNQQPCLEMARYNGNIPLEISWDDEPLQIVSAKTLFSLTTMHILLRRPSQVMAQASPLIWLGTNKRIDFDRLTSESCPWMWGYALLMAKRWLMPRINSSVSWPFTAQRIKEGGSWANAWIQDFARSSKGLFCLDHESLSNWSPLLKAWPEPLDPFEALEAMALSFSKRWVCLDMQRSLLEISTGGGFCPPSGHLEFCQEGLHVKALWRAARLREISIHSKLDRRLQLVVDPMPKSARLKKGSTRLQAQKNSSAAKNRLIAQGNLLDLELTAGAHYQLDRFEY